MLKKPIPPYLNIEDARRKFRGLKPSDPDDGSFPCPYCKGDENCRECEGTGIVDKSVFGNWFRKTIGEHRSEMMIYNNKMRRIKDILKKLTKDDIKLLKEYFD